MAVMPNFYGAVYGPLALCGLLRARRERGERLIAWGVVEVKAASNTEDLLGALAPPPLAAIATVASSVGGSKRVIVLTDRRMLLLRTGVHGPSAEGVGVVVDASLGTLRVEALATHFEVIGPEFGRRYRLTIKEAGSRDGERLAEALSALSEETG